MGYPTNSVDDDVFFYLCNDKKTGYFASNRAGGHGNMDIFFVNFADSSKYYLTVKGIVRKEDKSSDNIMLSVVDLDTKKIIKQVNVNSEGKYNTILKKGNKYAFIYEADKHFFEIKIINATDKNKQEKNVELVILQEIPSGDISKTYESKFTKKQKYNDENEVFLTVLLRFMKKNPEFMINVSSRKENNSKQNNKRTENTIDYLTAGGFPNKQIYVDLLESGNDENTLYVTVMDNATQEVAMKEKIDNSNTDNLSNKKGVFTNYTIQVGAFSKDIGVKNKFFSKLRNEVDVFYCKDKLYRYSYGGYKFKSDAQVQMLILHKLGYKDAFVRELKWYQKSM